MSRSRLHRLLSAATALTMLALSDCVVYPIGYPGPGYRGPGWHEHWR